MKEVAPVRRALAVRTVFNLLGPLTNPAAPPYALIGAYSAEAARLMADTLAGMPIERVFVIHGEPWTGDARRPYELYDVRPGRGRAARPRLARPLRSRSRGGDARQRQPARGVRGGARPHRARAAHAALALEYAATYGHGAAGRGEVDRGRRRACLKARGVAPPRARRGSGRPGLLADMQRSGYERVAAAKARVPEVELRAQIADSPLPPPLALADGGFDVIAELKLRSPSQGALARPSADPLARLAGYAQGGAAAVSVLTEPTRFDGSLGTRLAAGSARHTAS
jgi:hypothetical protein